METSDWHGLYKGGWTGVIVPEAFSHPAKFSRGLIERIYQHAVDEGWLSEGSTVVDIFGGVSLGAWPALRMGINWIAMELERPFVDLSAGCECTGISKADWVRFHGRWDKARYLKDRHWCPRCLAEAKVTLPEATPQLEMFASVPTASYRRNSGLIPHTEPHHYTGNLELFAKTARNGATATIIQGDSRELGKVLGQGFADGCISSPPWSSSLESKDINFIRKAAQDATDGKTKGHGFSQEYIDRMASRIVNGYGSHPAQLGNMPEGELGLDAAISSPPYVRYGTGHDGANVRLDATEDDRRRREGCTRRPAYGQTPGQLTAMPEGELDAAISSPPYAESIHNRSEATTEGDRQHRQRIGRNPDSGGSLPMREYGRSEGQLAAMPEGELDAAISSPPYAESLGSAKSSIDWSKQADRETSHPHGYDGGGYGVTEGQLAAMPEGEFGGFDGAISSPPYEGSVVALPKGKGKCQIENLRKAVERGDDIGREGLRMAHGGRHGLGNQLTRDMGQYGNSEGQLGQESGPTFWAASRTILQQLYRVLKPGGVAIFVTKRFVRNKQIVEFSQQWCQLCESVGFELVHWHKAWLVEDSGTQMALIGDDKRKVKKRFSFFRRLHAKKYPHLEIQWEDVLCLMKSKNR